MLARCDIIMRYWNTPGSVIFTGTWHWALTWNIYPLGLQDLTVYKRGLGIPHTSLKLLWPPGANFDSSEVDLKLFALVWPHAVIWPFGPLGPNIYYQIWHSDPQLLSAKFTLWCQSFAIQLAWFLIKSLFIWAIKTISFILWLHYLLVQIGLEVELGETLLAPGTRLNLGFTCLRVKAFSTPDNSSLILLALFLSSAMILICVISRLIKHHWTDTRDIWSVICFNS